MSLKIDPTAIVAPGAVLGEDVSIGPYAVIGKDVRIGSRTRIGSHAVIEGWTEIGEGCQISPHALIGTPPQDLKYKGEKTFIQIGEGTIIREFATIHRATTGFSGRTVLGKNNFIMAYAHVAHDCLLGDHVILANLATLAGHVEIEDYAIIGGLSAVHQFVRVGRYAMVGGCSGVLKDIPPYVKAQGNLAKLYGLNTVGLRRHGFSPETIRELKKAYRLLFLSGLNTSQALERVEKEVEPCPEVEHLVAFIKSSKRGICK